VKPLYLSQQVNGLFLPTVYPIHKASIYRKIEFKYFQYTPLKITEKNEEPYRRHERKNSCGINQGEWVKMWYWHKSAFYKQLSTISLPAYVNCIKPKPESHPNSYKRNPANMNRNRKIMTSGYILIHSLCWLYLSVWLTYSSFKESVNYSTGFCQ